MEPCTAFAVVFVGTNIVSLGDKRIWGDAAAQPPLSVECEATDSDHSVVTFNVMRGAARSATGLNRNISRGCRRSEFFSQSSLLASRTYISRSHGSSPRARGCCACRLPNHSRVLLPWILAVFTKHGFLPPRQVLQLT